MTTTTKYDDMSFSDLQETQWEHVVYLVEFECDEQNIAACPYEPVTQELLTEWDYGESCEDVESFYECCGRLSNHEWAIATHHDTNYLFVSQLGSISCYREVI